MEVSLGGMRRCKGGRAATLWQTLLGAKRLDRWTTASSSKATRAVAKELRVVDIDEQLARQGVKGRGRRQATLFGANEGK